MARFLQFTETGEMALVDCDNYKYIIQFFEKPLKRYTKRHTKNTIDKPKWDSFFFFFFNQNGILMFKKSTGSQEEENRKMKNGDNRKLA